MSILHHQFDTLDVTIKVVDRAKQVIDLTGAAFEVVAKRFQEEVLGSAVVVDAASGILKVSFGEGDLTPGWWNMQCRMTKGTQTDTILSEKVQVRNSPAG